MVKIKMKLKLKKQKKNCRHPEAIRISLDKALNFIRYYPKTQDNTHG